MYDADIAANLMNRWEESGVGLQEPASALELLREGGMRFKQTKHSSQENQSNEDDRREIECLAFDDGSTALRLLRLNSNRNLTPWAAVAPLRRLPEQIDECDY
jgi:hypothetical protein